MGESRREPNKVVAGLLSVLSIALAVGVAFSSWPLDIVDVCFLALALMPLYLVYRAYRDGV